MKDVQRRSENKNVKLMYWFMVFGGMLFFLPVLALYYEKTLFSITNVAIIFAIESFALVIFEVPSGAFADLFGRKRTIVLGHVIAVLSLIFLSIGGSMVMFIIYAVLTSFGRSLVSGSDSALLYDSLKEKNEESRYEKVIGTYYATWAVGATFGSLVGGYMATKSLHYPVFWTFLPMLIALGIILFLREPEYKKEGHKNVFRHMVDTARLAFTTRNFIIVLLAAFIMFGFGENLFMMSAIFFEFKGIPIEVLGYTMAALLILVALGEYYGHEIGKKFGRKRIMLIVTFCSPLLFLLSTFLAQYSAAAIFVLPAALFGFGHTIVNSLLNEGVESSKRATMVSLWNFSGELGIAAAAPFIGWMADLYTINTAFRISAIMLLSAFIVFLLLRPAKKDNSALRQV